MSARRVASQFFLVSPERFRGTILPVLYLHFLKWKKLDEDNCQGFRKTGKPGLLWLTDSYAPVRNLLTIFNFLKTRCMTLESLKSLTFPRLKGISVCFSMLKAALCGGYVNFGVFSLYGDNALQNALDTFMKLLLSIPHSDLLVS